MKNDKKKIELWKMIKLILFYQKNVLDFEIQYIDESAYRSECARKYTSNLSINYSSNSGEASSSPPVGSKNVCKPLIKVQHLPKLKSCIGISYSLQIVVLHNYY